MNKTIRKCAVIVCGFLTIMLYSLAGSSRLEASCGAVTCFVVIGSQQQVPQHGLLTINGIYNYTPMRLLGGTSGVIPAIDQERRRLILDHHRETRTITQTYTLDLNYGVTDRFGLELTIPYLKRTHGHLDGLGEEGLNGEGEAVHFADNGIGDIRVTAKYNVLPTLRSMVVLGFGVDLPTGDTRARDSSGGIMESPTQLGRGNVGLIGTIYQTYELIPHRLNQFAFVSYRHTFRNNDGYQFGDEYLLNVGLNLVTVPWLVLTNQLNYRYLVHDNISASLLQSLPVGTLAPDEPVPIDPTIKNRRVPNTGSTYLAYTPGFQINLGSLVEADWASMSSLYFYSQIPIARDANNNLAQGTSFVFGITKSFQVVNP
ncbi:MAG: hypothetical protein AB1555_02395 [Nitrospirota bacterium]